MRNLSIFLVFSFLFSIIHAQEPPEISIDSMLITIDKTDFTTGVLYDRTIPWANINSFNERENISNASHFEQSLFELYKASNEQKYTSHQALRPYYTPDSLKNEVDIGIINTSFNQLNYNEIDENEGALHFSDNKFEKINNNKEVFLKNHVLIISPLKEYLMGDHIIYHFENTFFIEENEGKNLVHLTANFDTATDYIVFENGNFTNPDIQVNYSEEGYKTLTFYATFSDGSSITTKGTLHVKLPAPLPPPLIENGYINADIPFQGFYGHLKYRIFYRANHNEQLRKPIIIVDGFDPGDKRKIQDSDSPLPNDIHYSIEDMMIYTVNNNAVKLVPLLRNMGYDVVIVNHPTYWRNGVKIDGGADYIERNALTHVKLYQHLNSLLAQNNSNEELVIIGPSMGGQISRYALAYMEKHGITHNTRLWVSIDSPHLGANIPIGLQSLINEAAASNVSAQDFVDNQLGSPAAKQQLIEQYNGSNGNQLNQQYFNARTISQGFSSNRGNPFFVNFYNNLFNNGLPNSQGYPQNLRKIAIVNGSIKGNKNFYNPFIEQQDSFINHGEMGLNIRGFQTICTWPICWDLHIASLESFHMPNYNNNTKVSRFKKAFSDKSKYATNINSRGNMDNSPGGWYPGFELLARPLDGSDPIVPSGGFWASFDGVLTTFFSILSDLIGGADFSIYKNEHVSSFIPTISALGFYNPNFTWRQELDRDLVCTGEIPFDSYFGPKNNEQHTTFTHESITWLLAELAGNPQPPTVYLNAGDINGPAVICGNDMVTYDFDTCKSPPVEEWEISNNLIVVTSGDFSITVEPISSTTNGAGFIKAIYNNHSVQKNIWIGKPSSPTFLNGPLEVDTGSMVSYSGGGSSGATSYEWILPYPFDENNDVHNPIDFNGSNWQTWPVNTPHNSHIFTGLGGDNGMVQLVGVNQCGDGGSIHLQVEHTNGGTCTTCHTPVIPVPNEADSHFNLDFSEYPPGTYYIYIYDASSNIMYEGTSTNVDKTVETINIPEGIYYLHIHDGNEVIIKQLVISH